MVSSLKTVLLFSFNTCASSVTQSCLTLCDPMDCILPGSSVHGTFQARILEYVAISFSRDFSWPRNQTLVSCISCTAGRFFTADIYTFIFFSFVYCGLNPVQYWVDLSYITHFCLVSNIRHSIYLLQVSLVIALGFLQMLFFRLRNIVSICFSFAKS